MAFSLLLLVLLTACDKQENKQILEYEGPLTEFENVEHYYSENDRVKVKMTAALSYEYESGDREFPKGIYIEFYAEDGKLESTLRANHALFIKKEDRWRGRGKVEVKNVLKNEQLNTEELYWQPKQEKIYTDKFVTIRQQGDVIYGEGLDARQDMSDYTILKPTGDFEVKDE